MVCCAIRWVGLWSGCADRVSVGWVVVGRRAPGRDAVGGVVLCPSGEVEMERGDAVDRRGVTYSGCESRGGVCTGSGRAGLGWIGLDGDEVGLVEGSSWCGAVC